MSSKNKKRRVETKLPAEFFVPDLTVPQLRGALQQHGIDHKPLKLKQELVDKLQQVLAEEKILQREQRIQSLGSNSSNSSASSSSSASSAASASKVATPANKSGFHRIASDTILAITQLLSFPEVAALARSCKLLNSLASLKLRGPPSLALARCGVVDTAASRLALSLTSTTRLKLAQRLQHLSRIDVDDLQFDEVLWPQCLIWLECLVKASARSLRHFCCAGFHIHTHLLPLLQSCPRLELVSLHRCDAIAPTAWQPSFPSLRSLVALQTHISPAQLQLLLRNSPNLQKLAIRSSTLTEDCFPLGGYAALQSLTLRLDIATFALDWLARMPALEALYISGYEPRVIASSKPLRHDALKDLTLFALTTDFSLLSLPKLGNLWTSTCKQSLRELEQIAPNLTSLHKQLTRRDLLDLVAESRQPADSKQPVLLSKLESLSLLGRHDKDGRFPVAPLLVPFASRRPQLRIELNWNELSVELKKFTKTGSAQEAAAVYVQAKDELQARRLVFGDALVNAPLELLLELSDLL